MGINAIVGQSGGPTCVINSSLAGVFSACRRHGVQKVFGMRHGVQGLLKDEVIDLTEALDAPGKLSLLRHTPSSYLGSCRYKLPESDQMEAVYQAISTRCAAMTSAISSISAATTAWIPSSN